MKEKNKLVHTKIHLQNKDSSPHTIRHYRTTLLEFHKFLYSQQKAEPMLASVTLEELSSYLSYKKECGTCGRTRRNYIITFRSFWKFSVRWGYTENNPTLWLEDIRVEKKERIYLTISEMQRFLQAIDHPLIYTACATICLSGLRISELCNLKIKDINFSRGEIHVICGKGKKEPRRGMLPSPRPFCESLKMACLCEAPDDSSQR